MAASTVTFVCCVEPGWLEPQVRLLIASIRRFGGHFAVAPVYAVQPRGGAPLAPETIEFFRSAGVVHRAGSWNSEHTDLPTCNKIYAMVLAEAETDADVLAFLDSDTVILGEPTLFRLPHDRHLAVQLHTRGFGGSTGPRDRADQYWQDAYSACGVAIPPYVTTLIDRKLIRGYYNAGLVVMRRGLGLAERWLDFLRRIEPFTRENRRYLDQFALATVAASLPDRTLLLPPVYNYNIRLRGEFPAALRSVDLDELIHVHYHNAFSRPHFLSRVWPRLNRETEQYRWLAERLPLMPVGKPWRHGPRFHLPWANVLRRFGRDLLSPSRGRPGYPDDLA